MRFYKDNDWYGRKLQGLNGHAKRAMMIAASGRLNALVIGPGGISDDSKCKVANIARDLLPQGAPFEAPHHTCSDVGMNWNKPSGYMQNAAGGILFLDSIHEFARSTLNVVERGDYMIIGGMEYCGCGMYLSKAERCKCTTSGIDRFRARVKPYLGLFDMIVELNQDEDFHDITLDIARNEVQRARDRLGDETSGGARINKVVATIIALSPWKSLEECIAEAKAYVDPFRELFDVEP